MSDKYRVMVQGEDGMLWCEGNNLKEDAAEELCRECVEERFENARAWIETETPPGFWPQDY